MSGRAQVIAERAYGLMGERQWDAAEELFSDDLTIHEAESLPFGGEWHGKDAMRRLVPSIYAYWDDPKVEHLGVIGNDEYASVLMNLTVTSKVTGNRFTQSVSEKVRVKGEQIVEIHVHYFDAAMVANEAGPPRKRF